MDPTPASLLEELKQPGNRAAWQRFARIYVPLLAQWARAKGLAEADADDLVQEVFVLLIKKLPQFEYDKSKKFRAWLFAVLSNHWKNTQRKKVEASAAPGALATIPEQRASVEEMEESEYRKHVLAAALQTIRDEFTSQTWQAFHQYVIECRPVREVAQQLGLTTGAVYSARFRVLERLKQIIHGLL